MSWNDLLYATIIAVVAFQLGRLAGWLSCMRSVRALIKKQVQARGFFWLASDRYTVTEIQSWPGKGETVKGVRS